MNRLCQILVTSICWTLLPADATACTCSGDGKPPTAAELIRQVRGQLNDGLAVFIGEPVSMNVLTVRFRVQSLWKGDLGSEVVMARRAEPTSDGLISSNTCIAGRRQ